MEEKYHDKKFPVTLVTRITKEQDDKLREQPENRSEVIRVLIDKKL